MPNWKRKTINLEVSIIDEKQFLRQIIDLAHVYHWEVAHFRPAMTKYGYRTPVQGDGSGFPDLVLARERVIFSELKAEKGKLTELQEHWQVVLREAGVEVYCWKPSQFEEIVEILKG